MFQPLERVSCNAFDFAFLMGGHNLSIVMLHCDGIMLCPDAC